MDGIIAMLPECVQKFSTHMDFPGQKAAERTFQNITSVANVLLIQVILVVSGFIGFGIGYYNQQLSHAIYTVLFGALLSALIVIPPWPFLFRKNPIVWQSTNHASIAAEVKNEKKSSEKRDNSENPKKDNKKNK